LRESHYVNSEEICQLQGQSFLNVIFQNILIRCKNMGFGMK